MHERMMSWHTHTLKHPVHLYQCCVALLRAEKNQELALPAGVAAGVAAMMSNPLVAEAAVTPSLRNLLGASTQVTAIVDFLTNRMMWRVV